MRNRITLLALLVCAPAACKSTEDKAAEAGADKAHAKPAESSAEPAKAAEPEKPAEPAPLQPLHNDAIRFSIDLPADHKVLSSDDKQIEFEITMPDRWTPSITVRREPMAIATEQQVRQNIKDGVLFGAVDRITKREDGAFIVEGPTETVANQERQKIRVYIGSLYAECGSNTSHMDYLRKICLSLKDTSGGAH